MPPVYITISPEIRGRFARAAIDCRTGERRFLSLVHECDAEGVFQKAARERGIFRIWKEEMDERFDRSGSDCAYWTIICVEKERVKSSALYIYIL